MSAEEKARKLAEMSSNAEWRDETRKNRVKKGREQDEKEEKEIKTNDHSYYRSDFLINFRVFLYDSYHMHFIKRTDWTR